MTQLGSIFEPEAGDGAGPRGRDLQAEVTVPAWACGHPDGYEVEVPAELPALGGYARRNLSPHDTGTGLRLHLPAGFPEGGTLRLRGQGEAPEGGRAGDLLVTVRLDRDAPAPPQNLFAALASTLASTRAATPTQVPARTSPPAPAALVWLVVAVFAVGLALVLAL